MLRVSLRRSQCLVPRTFGSQWVAPRQTQAWLAGSSKRYFAEQRKPDETVLPGSQSTIASENTPPTPGLETASSRIGNSAELAPIASEPLPSTAGIVPPAPLPPTGTGTSSVAPDVPPPPPPKPKRRLRRALFYLIILSALGYAGGVYYSLQSDNFHDFFTEYVPFGEDAVGYFEEREFKRRFPSAGKSPLRPQVSGEQKVTIPSKSGTTARPVTDLGSNGRHSSALDDNKASVAPSPTPKAAQDAKLENKSDSHTHDLLPKDSKSAAKIETRPAVAKKEEAGKPQPPAALIDNLTIKEGTEPVVQDVVKILNNIITVVNADNASGKYSSTIATAKAELAKVIEDISSLKAIERKAGDDKVKAAHSEFDNAAKELVRRLEGEMRDQETHFKEEYEAEREKLAQSYDHKLKTELDSAKKVYEQKLQNELLEQSISLQRQFTDSIRNHVETERNNRLSKLDDLSHTVQDLKKLTGAWNEVVDANLKTQHLVVAVEAVRAVIEQAEKPTPFISELAALKEVATDSPVVSAAIASINPSAYQRGIPAPSQIIDRFRRVASEVRKASLLPENAGVASHLASVVLSKVMFKKSGLPAGSDVESVLTRTEVLLEEGDLDGATREMNQLNGWAKLLAKDWLGDARRVLEVKQALEVMATEARLQSLLVE